MNSSAQRGLVILLLALGMLPGVAHAQAVVDVTTEQVCASGYSATVRPPTSYISRVKRQLMARDGVPASQASQLVVDHIVPLELGGAPRDLDNLQLQSRADSRVKDRAENAMRRLVCRGLMSLTDAQEYFSTDDWRVDFGP